MENTTSTPPPEAPPPATMPGADVPKDAKTMAMLAHLLGIFFSFIPALIIWLTKKDSSPFIDDQAREALNFQITIAIGWVAAIVLSFILIGALLIPVLIIVNLIFCILAALKANEGVMYRYPFALRLVK